MVASEYVKYLKFKDSLRYDLQVLIAPQRERVFVILIDKTKILEEVKCTKCEKRDRERGQSKVKMDSGPSGSIQRPKKWASSDVPPKNEASVTCNVIPRCADYERCHPGECWTKFGACLCCGSMEHRVRDYPHRLNQVLAPTSEAAASTV